MKKYLSPFFTISIFLISCSTSKSKKVNYVEEIKDSMVYPKIGAYVYIGEEKIYDNKDYFINFNGKIHDTLIRQLILDYGDSFYYLGTNNIRNMMGRQYNSFKSFNSIQSLKYHLPAISHNCVDYFLSEIDELAYQAFNVDSININIYIEKIICEGSGHYFVNFIKRYAFNSPASEQFEFLIFPFMTSLDDEILFNSLLTFDLQTLKLLNKILFIDGYGLGDELNENYFKNLYPKSYALISR